MVGQRLWSVMILALHYYQARLASSVLQEEPLVLSLAEGNHQSDWILRKGMHMDDAVNDAADADIAEGVHADGAEDASSGS